MRNDLSAVKADINGIGHIDPKTIIKARFSQENVTIFDPMMMGFFPVVIDDV